MIPDIPNVIATVVIAGNIAIAIAVFLALSRGAARSGLTPDSQRRVRVGSAVFFGVWLATVFLFAPTSSSPPPPIPSPWWVPAFAVPVIGLGARAGTCSPAG